MKLTVQKRKGFLVVVKKLIITTGSYEFSKLYLSFRNKPFIRLNTGWSMQIIRVYVEILLY